MKAAAPASPFYRITTEADGRMIIHFSGDMNVATAPGILASLCPFIEDRPPAALSADLSGVTSIDDYGALLLAELKEGLSVQPGVFSVVNTAHLPQEILALIDFKTSPRCATPRRQAKSFDLMVRLGDATINHFYNTRLMIAFMGSVFLAFVRVLRAPRSLRYDDTIKHMEKTGVDAIPIVALISFLLGFIMAFMSSMQLRQFGANIYVASLVALAMISELGPIMTAIVVAGRTGSAFAAEIGTMKIYEEVDALYSMGFDPTLFLVVPRMIACVVVVPILTLFSDIFAIVGGLVIGVSMLKLSPGSYIAQTIETLKLTEIIWGFAKSIIFAMLVSWIACLRGFQARGGAASVGNAATSAVVSSIFLIILFDSLFAVIRTYWG